jgi:hypothetical protein
MEGFRLFRSITFKPEGASVSDRSRIAVSGFGNNEGSIRGAIINSLYFFVKIALRDTNRGQNSVVKFSGRCNIIRTNHYLSKHSGFSLSKLTLRSEFPRYQPPALCHIIQRFANLSMP